MDRSLEGQRHPCATGWVLAGSFWSWTPQKLPVSKDDELPVGLLGVLLSGSGEQLARCSRDAGAEISRTGKFVFVGLAAAVTAGDHVSDQRE